MLAQRLALILLAEQPAALQFGDDEVDKLRERAGEIGRQDVVAIGCPFDEPLFEDVGDLDRRAGDNPMPARRGGERSRKVMFSRFAISYSTL
jgi:hypothetical protein